MKQKALDRKDRQYQIMQCFAAELMQGNSGEMTIADIARCMHLAVSTKLRIMVNELVADGMLDYRNEPIPGIAKFRRVYSPDPKHFQRPKPMYKGEGREVKINSRQGSFLTLIGG